MAQHLHGLAEAIRSGRSMHPLSLYLTQRPSPGDIVHVDLMGQHMVILNRLEDAEELWSKRGQNYSDRLRPRFAVEM